jgi:ABC-type phosphate transport system auxiliary subunit
MTSLSNIGMILLAGSAFLFYLTTDFTVEKINISHVMGVMAGIGIGLIFGGMVGYVSKGSAIKAEAKKREFKQLQKEKEELEKQAIEIEKRQAELERENTNPQI